MKKVSAFVLLTIIAGLILPVAGCARHRLPNWYTVTGSGVLNPDYPPGQARLMARRAAEEDARRQMLEAVKGVAIDSKTSVRDFMLQDDYIRSRVQGYIRGAQTIDTRYLEDGTVELDMRIDLNRVRDIVR